MNDWQIILVIIGVVAAAFAGICFLMPWLVKKGVNLSNIFNATTTVLDTAEVVLEGVGNIIESPALNAVDKLIEYAQKGVAAAEQMYKASQINADERNATATQLVYDCLAAAGIEITPEIEKIISGMIEAAVLVLPKTGVEKTGDE